MSYFGLRYFGKRYFGGRFFGGTVDGGGSTGEPVNATLDYTARRTKTHYTWSYSVLGPLIEQSATKHPDDVVDLAVDFTRRLPAGVILTGTPTASVISGAGLTVGNVAVNSGTVEINGRNVKAGGAVLVRVSAGTDGVTYRIQVEGVTSASSPETINAVLDLVVSTT